ncbi:pleckstrin homology domain-containing family A member 4 isoform X3 [Electrophorus electricus]|uniref:pleckstrin homology domain-containing family A member 4 isoform X3 n=1 Tax=Electrophorus electricus TaxID=8005 RepID=UPI0015CFF961|nr:pleckstrin homology domain-containing family A member 4 isoform X3 [Electrophorus electricus]
MELQIAFGSRQMIRMEDQDRVSQASSIATISSLTTRNRDNEKVQTFGKRCQAVKRDPNCPVVIRGWLYKRDSTGLKLWKRRWFVLSDYCLFYYKDSREESVLGSIPLPSYKILFCSPRECKNRKYAFKVVHQGMRSYLLSADTQEDMLGWVRALSQSACMETDCIINRRCASYQDFTQIEGSTESVDLPLRGGMTLSSSQIYSAQKAPPHLTGGGVDVLEQRGRHRQRVPDTRARSLSLDHTVDEPCISPHLTQGSCPTTPRGQYGSRPHTPVGRVDMRPHESQLVPPGPSNTMPNSRRWHTKGRYSDQLPPLPPSRVTHNSPCPAPSLLPHSRGPVYVDLPPMHVQCERETQALTALQADTDMVLTRLCGCDKLLQTLSVEMSHLQADKERAQFALEMTHLQLDDWQLEEQEVSQKALLQDELITIRARMCDVSLEMERVWVDYERMESELCVFHSHLQHICHFGLSQERSQAQRQLWMMEDILCGLKANRSHFRAMLVLSPPLQNSPVHPMENIQYSGEESEPPSRPPLPYELQSANHSTDQRPDWVKPCHKIAFGTNPLNTLNHSSRQPSFHRETNPSESQSVYGWMESDLSIKKGMTIEAEKSERKLNHDQAKLTNKRKHKENLANQTSTSSHLKEQSCPADSQPSPLRVMRVVTAVLPSSLVARRVSVEDPPPELTTLLPEKISQLSRSDSSRRTPTKPRRLLFESPNQDKNSRRGEASEEMPAQKPEERRNKATSKDSAGVPTKGELNALCGVNQECDPTIKDDQRGAKLRRVERIRERVLRSAVRGTGLEAVHPLKLIRASEMVDSSRDDSDPVNQYTDTVCIQDCQGAFQDSTSVKLHPTGEVCQTDPGETTQISNAVHPKALSTNHISTLTVISEKEPQETNNMQTFQKQNLGKHSLNCSASTSQRAEWFLSTSQWQEFIPLNIKDDELSLFPTDDQHLDQSTSQAGYSKKQNVSNSVSGDQMLGHSPEVLVALEMLNQTTAQSTEDFRNIVANQQSDEVSIQPIANSSDNHMTCPSHHSGMDLCIYEEIQYKDSVLKSTRETHGTTPSNPTHQTAEPLSPSPDTTLDTGGKKNGTTQDKKESARETGSDIIVSSKAGQPVYSCVLKNSVTNHNATFVKPRVIAMRTSL